MSEEVNVPTCPGCHFGCAVDSYKCGRGKGFYKLWQDGKPVPERGVPPMMRTAKADGVAQGADKGAGVRPAAENKQREGRSGAPVPVGARVMHGLNIVANILQDRHTESAERKVLMAVSRQGSFFATDMLGKRTLVEDDRLLEAIEELVAAGYAVRDQDEIAGDILRITEAGAAQQSVWNAEREEATADFLAPLDEEEQDQFATMLFRLIQPQVQH